jgi:hypothetical protein
MAPALRTSQMRAFQVELKGLKWGRPAGSKGRDMAEKVGFEPGKLRNENIGPAIVVVIENRDACACRFDNAFFCIDSAENIRHRKSGFLGYIYEIGEWFGLSRSLSSKCESNNKKNERG